MSIYFFQFFGKTKKPKKEEYLKTHKHYGIIMIITLYNIFPPYYRNQNMPVSKRPVYNNKKHKKIEPESSSSSESETESESESEYKSSSPSNRSRSLVESDEDETIYTECGSDEEEEDGEDEDEEEIFDHKNFKKALAKMFPSKYSDARARESTNKDTTKNKKETTTTKKESTKKHKSKRIVEESSDSEEDAESPKKSSSSKKSKKHKQEKEKEKRSKRKATEESDNGSDSDSDYDSAEEDREEGKFIILNIGGGNDDDYDDDSEAESLTEDTAEEFDSDAEKTFMGDAYETPSPLDESGNNVPIKNAKKNKHSKSKNASKNASNKATEEEDRAPIPADIEAEYKEMLDVRKMLTDQLKRRPKNRFLQSSLDKCDANIKKLTRKARHANTNTYYKLVNSEKRQTNEIDYFKHRLSNKEQQSIMSDLKEINRTIYSEKPYRLSILQSKIPSKFKALAMQRLNTLKSMDPSDHEYYKIKNWVDAFMRIPFGVYRSIDVRMTDGIDVCNEFMENAKKTLDDCVYGLDDAKLQIMQMLGQWIVNPNSIGTSIAIHGPPGTGKTSIVKDGISKILGREFAFIALGGCGDGSFLEGHSYTYEGSMWGKIVQILMECKSMNPIIYFDELDKVSDTPRGQEIVGILTHLTDTTQNTEFHDKYFSEVSLDLSKCLFIFSYNDEQAVNPILKDRMYRIQTKGYDVKEKITIARDYLLPKIREQVSFTADDIHITEETLQYIISTTHLTKGESGVRNLKRCLEIVYTKLNLYRLVKPGNAMFEKDLGVKVQFPITITKKEVDIFIKNNETHNPSVLAMYV